MNSKVKPPRFADQFFLWFCNRANIEDLHGDAEELFHTDVKTHGVFKARLRYWGKIFSLMFSYALKLRRKQAAHHQFSSGSVNFVMIKNYLKTASRSLAKNRFFTILNVFSLALGMSISLLFVATISFLYRYDNFHENKSRISRITTQVSDKIDNPHYASAPAALLQRLSDVPAIEKIVPIQQTLQGEAEYHQKKIYLDRFFTTPDFFTVFNFPLLKGNAVSALTNLNSIVITERQAEKIFGSKDPMGEVIRLEPFGDFVVTGILKALPKNSHLQFDALASYGTWTSHKGNTFMEREEGWTHFTNSYLYVMLHENAQLSDVSRYLDPIAREKYPSQNDVTASFVMQPLKEIVPGPRLDDSIGPTWDYTSMILVGLITFIILIPACANYMNLSISQSLNRMKEIGVRKVMGGQKKHIFFQFIMESMLTMMLALIASFFIFQLIRGEYMENFVNADTMDLTPTPLVLLNFILFALLVGFIAGIVPALYFARLRPVTALKGKPESSLTGARFSIRNVLITLQLILSLGFIMSVVIMYQQYRYSVNYDLGFSQHNLLDVELQDTDPQRFRNEFEKLTSVQQVSMSSHILGVGGSFTRYIRTSDQTDSIEVNAMSVNENFIPAMKLSIIAGENFSSNRTKQTDIIVNEEFVRKFNLVDPWSAVNNHVTLMDGTDVRIAGVVKNFHYAGLRDAIGCFYLESDPTKFNYANLTLATGTGFEQIADMEAVWKKTGSEQKFQAHFLTDEIAEAYSFYFLLIKLWGFLGLMAITVACLGLLGTVVFTIRNRVKEVSIRKVMGASSGTLVLLLSKKFIMLMLIAGIITIPAVYLMFQKWLLVSVQFYSIQIGVLEAVISLVIMFILGMATILSQTLKAANTNPVDNLRME